MPRTRDAFIFYDCLSRVGESRDSAKEIALVCVSCGYVGVWDKCPECGRSYRFVDDMLFLLREQDMEIADAYSSESAALVPKEHL
jgi:hypothetical protein